MGHIEGVFLTPLIVIEQENGRVRHGIKLTDPGFSQFGEAYFSEVNKKAVKGWKKHIRMTLNLIVPVGSIHFVLYDDRHESPTHQTIMEQEIGTANYARLTIPPGIYVSFKGLEDHNMLLNVASIPHDPDEAVNLPLDIDFIPYEW